MTKKVEEEESSLAKKPGTRPFPPIHLPFAFLGPSYSLATQGGERRKGESEKAAQEFHKRSFCSKKFERREKERAHGEGKRRKVEGVKGSPPDFNSPRTEKTAGKKRSWMAAPGPWSANPADPLGS